MKIVLAQTHIHWENKAENIKQASTLATQAKNNGAEMILFPEMSFTGFSMNTDLTGETDDYSLGRIRKMAKELSIAIGFGWVKKLATKAENHYTVVAESGEILSDYVKIHPFSYGGEADYFIGGDKVICFPYKGHVFASLICYDLRFPELFQIVSKEADVIFVPANWPKRRELHWNVLLQARAIENQAYVLGINCVGEMGGLQYSGCSSAYDPSGTLLSSTQKVNELLYVDILDNTKEIRQQFPVKMDRKCDLYVDLYKNNQMFLGETK